MAREVKFEAYVEDNIIENRPAETYQVMALDWDDDGLKCAQLFSTRTQTFYTLEAKWFKLIQLRDNEPKLLEALKEIAKGEGKYNRNYLQHAENVIKNMKAIADKAIALVE